MTTTSTTTLPRRRKPKQQKAVEAAKKIAFPIFLVVTGGIMALVLITLGMAPVPADVVDASYAYDDRLAVAVFIYNLVIMIWPTILLVKMATKKRPLILPRVIIIVGSVILTLPPLMSFWVNLFGGFGRGLWAFPVTGFLACFAALLLHGAAAYLLTRYAVVKPQLIEDQKTKQSLEGIVRKDGTIVREGLVQAARTDTINTQAALTAQEGVVAGHSAEATRLQDIVDNRSKIATKAKEALDGMTLNTVDLPAAKAAVDAQQTKISEQQAVVDALKIRVKTALHEDRGARQSEHDAAKREHDTLVEGLPDLQRIVNELEARINSSPEKAAYDAALADSNAASAAATAHHTVVEEADKQLTKVTDAHKAATTKLTNLEKQLADANNRIKENAKSSRNLWGDAVFGPVVCLVAAIVLDSSFYGWVAVTIVGAAH